MKVYAVMDVDYDYTEVVAIVTDKDKAEELAKRWGLYVEDFELDETGVPDDPNLTPFTVHEPIWDGGSMRVYESDRPFGSFNQIYWAIDRDDAIRQYNEYKKKEAEECL